ncbi:hypothetical protein LTS18_001919, partial [Coniosporium uncinatum]
MAPMSQKDATVESAAKLGEIVQESQKAASSTQTSTAEQQSDNVAHALAGAGGGLLSMALT